MGYRFLLLRLLVSALGQPEGACLRGAPSGTERRWRWRWLCCAQVNCILLAMDNHGVRPGSLLHMVLDATDAVFAVFFAVEMGLKLVAWGAWSCGQGYVRGKFLPYT
jgi:hypothetical protein